MRCTDSPSLTQQHSRYNMYWVFDKIKSVFWKKECDWRVLARSHGRGKDKIIGKLLEKLFWSCMTWDYTTFRNFKTLQQKLEHVKPSTLAVFIKSFRTTCSCLTISRSACNNITISFIETPCFISGLGMKSGKLCFKFLFILILYILLILII